MFKKIAPALALLFLSASLASAQAIPWTPPPCGGIFADVPCTPGVGFSDWIEALSTEGITAGCGGGNFCPTAPVTREQMAVFLLKLEHRTVYGKAGPTCGNPGDFCPSFTVTDPQITSTMNIVATFFDLGGVQTIFWPLQILSLSDGSFTVAGQGGSTFFYSARER